MQPQAAPAEGDASEQAQTRKPRKSFTGSAASARTVPSSSVRKTPPKLPPHPSRRGRPRRRSRSPGQVPQGPFQELPPQVAQVPEREGRSLPNAGKARSERRLRTGGPQATGSLRKRRPSKRRPLKRSPTRRSLSRRSATGRSPQGRTPRQSPGQQDWDDDNFGNSIHYQPKRQNLRGLPSDQQIHWEPTDPYHPSSQALSLPQIMPDENRRGGYVNGNVNGNVKGGFNRSRRNYRKKREG